MRFLGSWMPSKSSWAAACLAAGLTLCSAVSLETPAEKPTLTVVIDAGHGGKDPGCLGSEARESYVVLDVALRVGKLIETHQPDVKVIYTRKTDVFVELHERVRIANQEGADVFISIHANSNPYPRVQGSETYVMGVSDSPDNLAVAMRENASVLLEDDHQERYQDFNPREPSSRIRLFNFQNAYLENSMRLATHVERQFSEGIQRKSRGVLQESFYVLAKTAMPSVLVEIGYLTNKEDQAYLKTELGQAYVSAAIYRAFRDYKKEIVARREKRKAEGRG